MDFHNCNNLQIYFSQHFCKTILYFPVHIVLWIKKVNCFVLYKFALNEYNVCIKQILYSFLHLKSVVPRICLRAWRTKFN